MQGRGTLLAGLLVLAGLLSFVRVPAVPCRLSGAAGGVVALVAATLSLAKSPLQQRLLGLLLGALATALVRSGQSMGVGAAFGALGAWYFIWPDKKVVEFELM